MSDFLLEVALGMPHQIALTVALGMPHQIALTVALGMPHQKAPICETSVAVRKSAGKWCLENIYASDGR